MKKENEPFTFSGKYFLLVVLAVYGILFIFNSQAAIIAMQKSLNILLKILPVLIIVILLTALLNYFLKPKQIAGHLGKDSGFKGWFWALTAGILSHGPMYAWYSLLEELRTHGMRDGLVVVFFSARAIKIPLLPVMIDYFGWVFTLILSVYILIGALIQGWIMESITQKKVKN